MCSNERYQSVTMHAHRRHFVQMEIEEALYFASFISIRVMYVTYTIPYCCSGCIFRFLLDLIDHVIHEKVKGFA